jgi:CO dehydrogenase/acetyl-CoA synthase complex epsilon subunit
VARHEPWQTAETCGTRAAGIIRNPQVLAVLLKKARHPLMLVGNQGSRDPEEADEALTAVLFLAQKADIPIVTSGKAVRSCRERGLLPAATIPATDCANRLADPSWAGVDDKGPYDLVFIIGLPYGMEWTLFSGLKNGAPALITVALDRYYHPQASWSFENISHQEWLEMMNETTRTIER